MRGARQTAWQVLVAGTPETLQRGAGDLWDSGRLASSETVHIPYGGRPLGTSERVHWKVRVWEAAGEPSEWSTPSTWVTGVMSPGDRRDGHQCVGNGWPWASRISQSCRFQRRSRLPVSPVNQV